MTEDNPGAAGADEAVDEAIVKAAEAAIATATADVGRRWEVRGPEGGRRRAGYRFTPTPLLIVVADLTASQRRLILEDPSLSVREIPAG